MQIPGANILAIALGVLASQTFTYFAFVQRTPQPNGLYVDTYTAGMTFRGSVQPVPRSMFERLGLDFQKTYVNVFLPREVVDVDRDVSSDYIVFGNMVQPGPFQITTDGLNPITTDAGNPIVTDQGSSPQAAKYQALSATRWFSVDGWTQVLCVLVPYVA